MDDQPILLEPELLAAPVALPVPASAARWAAGAMALALFVGATGAGARAATHFISASNPAPASARPAPLAVRPSPIAPPIPPAVAVAAEASALDTGFAAGVDTR